MIDELRPRKPRLTKRAPFGQTHRRATRGMLQQLGVVEAPEVLDVTSDFPIVLSRATGCRVRDLDGNRYIDLTGFFGAALVGHRNPAVVRALRVQAGRLLHAMGDVHPADVKARFLSALSACLPACGYRTVLSHNGCDAVETALKFAAVATGRAKVIAFEGAYHGLSLGALEVTHRSEFRDPFAHLLSGRAAFVPFPTEGRDTDAVLSTVQTLGAAGDRGAVIVEPIQGRGGIRVPPAGFMAALCEVAHRHDMLVISDEIYCGTGRTGRFLAGDWDGMVPDAVCLGKALGGGIPFSACAMLPRMADAVHRAGAEAVHTATFLGNPLGCVAGLAVLGELRRLDATTAARRIETTIRERALRWQRDFSFVGPACGRGAMMGVPLQSDAASAGGDKAFRVISGALKTGVILLSEGPAGDVLAFTPPLVISDQDLGFALDVVERQLEAIRDRG